MADTFNQLRKILASERADTLVEVVFALGILTAVLTSSVGLATSALRSGQTARERTQLADEAQYQVEVLRAFRDNHTWAEFLNGSALGSYTGVLNYTGSSGCVVVSPCFHMQLGSAGPGATEYTPRGGVKTGSVPTSYMELSVVAPPGAGVPPTVLDVTLNYGFVGAGGGINNTGHIKTRFTDIRMLSGAGGPGLPTPTPGP